MAHHLIFIEQSVSAGKPIAEVFKQVGLEDHVGGVTPFPLNAEDSPSGEPGILYGWLHKVGAQLCVNKEKQTWKKSHSGYWVGVWKDDLPTESDLRRPYMQPAGSWIQNKAGGEPWKFPIPSTLDQRLALADDGTWKYVPLREHSWYIEECEKRRKQMAMVDENGETKFRFMAFSNPADDINLVIRGLRINYRITPEVCDMAEMFTVQEVTHAYATMLGLELPAGFME